MKNKFTILTAIFLLLTIGFGCSYIDSLKSGETPANTSNPANTSSNSTTNSANPNDSAKTGVAECDELIELLDKDQRNPDDNFLSRKIREYAIDFAKESIKKNIEENKGDKTKIAKGCREARDEYLKNKEKNNNQDAPKEDKSGTTQKS